MFLHRLKQRRLRARRGAVDFVGEQNVGEHRAFVEMKLLVALVENGDAKNIRRQQVGRELQALELRGDGFSERLGQRGFAGAGIIFKQNVAARRERREQMPRGFALAAHDAGDVGGNFGVGFARGGRRVRGHVGHSKTPRGFLSNPEIPSRPIFLPSRVPGVQLSNRCTSLSLPMILISA